MSSLTCSFLSRWILLCFKREFSHKDGFRLFEMLSARDLEFSTFEAARHQNMFLKSESARSGLFSVAFNRAALVPTQCSVLSGVQRVSVSPLQEDLTFDVFVCAAILVSQRDHLFRCEGMHDVYGHIARSVY